MGSTRPKTLTIRFLSTCVPMSKTYLEQQVIGILGSPFIPFPWIGLILNRRFECEIFGLVWFGWMGNVTSSRVSVLDDVRFVCVFWFNTRAGFLMDVRFISNGRFFRSPLMMNIRTSTEAHHINENRWLLDCLSPLVFYFLCFNSPRDYIATTL